MVDLLLTDRARIYPGKGGRPNGTQKTYSHPLPDETTEEYAQRLKKENGDHRIRWGELNKNSRNRWKKIAYKKKKEFDNIQWKDMI